MPGARLPVPRRWTLWTVPLAAAAAVIALAVALVVVKDLPAAARHPPSPPTRRPRACRPTTWHPRPSARRKSATRPAWWWAIRSPGPGWPRCRRLPRDLRGGVGRRRRPDVSHRHGRLPPERDGGAALTWYLITIAPGSSTPVRRTRLLIPAGPTGADVESLALSASGASSRWLTTRVEVAGHDGPADLLDHHRTAAAQLVDERRCPARHARYIQNVSQQRAELGRRRTLVTFTTDWPPVASQ